MKMEKKRLDILLVERGLTDSREKAKASIMAGEVLVDGQVEDKAGSRFPEEAVIELKSRSLRYVSRGGLKLEKALVAFDLDLNNSVCLDIGASTGGFSDCMLQNGAKKVYAIDVGYGQLSWKLRTDDRVIPMEKTNFRYLKRGDLPEEPDFASCDVSFISLSKMLPPAYDILKDGGEMVCLIKPQFEAGKEKVGKKGVVRDPKVHEEVITKVIKYAEDCGFRVLGIDHSPIKGPEGNIEYLIYLVKGNDGKITGDLPEIVKETVKEAHEKDKQILNSDQ